MNSEEKKKIVLETQQTLKDGKQVKKEKHKTVKKIGKTQPIFF